MVDFTDLRLELIRTRTFVPTWRTYVVNSGNCAQINYNAMLDYSAIEDSFQIYAVILNDLHHYLRKYSTL